ncbi:hypothetical protein EON71_01040 [bacterium]|nr:MAG: hypothetical protein EON71_01040 [bacterium]
MSDRRQTETFAARYVKSPPDRYTTLINMYNSGTPQQQAAISDALNTPVRSTDGLFNDGYLFSGKITNMVSMSDPSNPLSYVSFSLLCETTPMQGGFNLILSQKILSHRSFRYNFEWIGYDYENTIKVKTTSKKKINSVLNRIMTYIGKNESDIKLFNIMPPEILFKKKVNLRKYLVAISPKYNYKMTHKDIQNINDNYPGVLILDNMPQTSDDMDSLLKKI